MAIRRSYWALFLGLFIACGCMPVLAQQAPAPAAPAEELQEVIVTGTRILSPNVKATSPTTIVTARDIQVSGMSDISDVLYQLPQNFNNSIGQDFSGRTPGLTGAGGTSTVDLRGLGPNRTLVLIDGIRLGNGDANTAVASPAPDLDQIPALLVERVDILTGGASSVYGSDAIAGVVNFVMKKNFEGIEVDYKMGENWHNNHSTLSQDTAAAAGFGAPTGVTNDGRNKNLNLIFGTNFADGKGNITGYLGFLHQDPVYSGQRDFGACEAVLNAAGTGPSCVGSGSLTSNYFQPNGFGQAYSVYGNQFVPQGSVATTPPQYFNSEPYITIQRQDERYSGGFLGHLDLADYAKPYVSFGFMNDKTMTYVAASGLFKGDNVLTADGNYLVNCSNPLLSTQQQGLLCTPAQIAADRAAPGSPAGLADVSIGRRNLEGGDRTADYEHTNYRAVFGIKGDFASAWNYDVYGMYYTTSLYVDNGGYLNFQSIANALLVTGTASNPVCISGGSCVPYNIWKQGGVTPAALAYLTTPGTEYGTNTERVYHADIGVDLGKYGVKSPFAKDGIAINFGYENRHEFVSYQPDSAEESGLLSGSGGASAAISNGYGVGDEFVEGRLPIASDLPGVEELTADVGARRSDYSTSGVSNTRKFGVQYAPTKDVRLRASYNLAIREPSVIELYNPQLVGNIGYGLDPCAPSPNGPATATLAQCERSGVTAAQYGNGGSTSHVPQGTASQLSQEQGGNPNLKPEQSQSYTLGLTFTPTFLPNFVSTVDYYRIQLKNIVGSLPADVLLPSCLATGNPLYCSQIVRNPINGGLIGGTVAGGGYIVQTDVNIGAETVSGIDVSMNYRLPLDNFGKLLLDLAGTYVLKNSTTNFVGGPTYDCAGLFGPTCETVNPRWRHTFRATWETPWNVDLTATWRFIGKVGFEGNSGDPNLTDSNAYVQFTPGYNLFNATIPNYSYIDLAVVWHAMEHLEVRAGIDNLLDKDPPFVTSDLVAGGSPNTYETYDTLGRQLFLGFTVKF